VKAASIVQLCDDEQQRLERRVAARKRRDDAQREYARTRRALARLQGKERSHKGQFVTEKQLNDAHEAVYQARCELAKAQRELLRSM